MVQMVKKLPAMQEPGAIPRSGRSPEEGKSLPTPVSLPGESHGQRNLAGYYKSMGLQRVGHDRATNIFNLNDNLPYYRIELPSLPRTEM